MGSALVVGAIAFALAVGFWLWITRNILTHLISEYRPHFPAKEPIKGD